MRELSTLHPHGVFLRREAVAWGYTDRDLARERRSGALVRIRHGAYVDAGTWERSDHEGRHVLACHAVHLSHQTPIAFSHASGALLHGMAVWGSDLSRVHVTRLEATASRKHHDVAYHEMFGSEPLWQVHGVPVASPALCAMGVTTMTTVEAGLATVDSALHRGVCTLDDLRTAYERIRNWPGSARLQITLRLAMPGAESVGESRARFLFFRQKLPRPVLQFSVYDRGELIGIADFAWPEYGLLGEFDGRIKYGRLLRAGESPADAVYREKVREDRMREVTGWRMIRFNWADLDRPHETGERVRVALRGLAA